MANRKGLDFDAMITVYRHHPISCDVDSDEAQFRLGRNGGGVVLCFTWAALARFLRVAREVTRLSKQGLRPGPANYVVYADELSRQIHNPHNTIAGEKEIILRVGPNKKNR
jgi:hypothetical protein